MSETKPSPTSKAPFRKSRLFPQTARQALEPLITPMAKKRGFAEVRILTDWATIVGERLAAHSRPLSIQGTPNQRTLLVAVAPAFATDLHYQQPQILERIATYCGARVIHSLNFLQQPIGTAQPAAASPSAFPALPGFPPLGAVVKTAEAKTTSSKDESRAALGDAIGALAKALQDGEQLT
jgi:hypothetical protein